MENVIGSLTGALVAIVILYVSVAFVAYYEGRTDGRNYRHYRNDYKLYAYLYNLGFTRGESLRDKQESYADRIRRNKEKYGRWTD